MRKRGDPHVSILPYAIDFQFLISYSSAFAFDDPSLEGFFVFLLHLSSLPIYSIPLWALFLVAFEMSCSQGFAFSPYVRSVYPYNLFHLVHL